MDGTATADQARQHRAGVALILLSTVPIAFSGIFARLVSADILTLLAWRGLIGGAIILAYTEWQRVSEPRPGLGWRGWVLATVGSVASLAFVGAFRGTWVANVTVIYTFAPFAAAGLGWLILRERVRPEVMGTAIVCTLGIAIMVHAGIGTPNAQGDLIAIASMGLSALYMVLVRAFAGTPAVLAGVLSSAQILAVGFLISDPLALPAADVLPTVLFGINFAATFILWTEGARRIPAAEAGLYGGAETPLAVLFAWAILAE